MRGAGAGVVILMSFVAVVGCTPAKVVSISTRPPDASIRIDGIERGRGPITERFTFAYPGDVHYVIATKPGYFKSQEIRIGPEFAKENLILELRPARRTVTFRVSPVPAVVRVNGKAVNAEPATEVTKDLEAPDDPSQTLTAFVVTAEAPGYQTARRTITPRDGATEYALQLVPAAGDVSADEPAKRELTILTAPAGADVYVDDQFYGNTKAGPVTLPFPSDKQTGRPRAAAAVRAEKAGYEPTVRDVRWEEAKAEVRIELAPHAKTVRIIPDPPGATVEIQGARVTREGAEGNGASTARLVFTPVNEQGELPTFEATVTPPADDAGRHQARQFTIGWDSGQNEYPVKLEPAAPVARTVPLLRPTLARGDDGAWRAAAERIDTREVKETNEGDGADATAPQQITHLPERVAVGSLCLAPDGSQLLFTTLSTGPDGAPKSQLFALSPDGSGAAKALTDGSHLDVTPTFTPDGTRVVFASDRGGPGLGLYVMPLAGGGGGEATPITGAEGAADLWPSVDASPRPRVFFESHRKGQSGPALFMAPLAGGGPRTDLMVKLPVGATQPRVGPTADVVVFAAADPNTGKRDLYRVSDQGGGPANLTNTPDVDEFDPAWSPDGRRIAYASDPAGPGQPQNYDVWVMDLADPQHPPRQVTRSAAWDDSPVFDVTGRAVYFRSNRGGAWQIWRSAVQ